jgi:hypothetical protein
MSDPTNEALVLRLETLRSKADLQTTAHAWLQDHYDSQNSVLTLVSVLAGVILVALVLVSPGYFQQATGVSPQIYQITVAALAILDFSVVVVLLAWRLDVRATEHGRAVQHYAKWTHAFRDAMLNPEKLTSETVVRIERQYMDVEDLPRIPEDRFLKLKRWHLLKVQLSRELDKNPQESLWKIRRRLRAEGTTPVKTAVRSEDEPEASR